MAKFNKEVVITANSEMEATTRRVYLQTLEKNLDTETLRILSEKCSAPGIGEKVKAFQHMI
jgi:hypothetical protein